MLWLRSSVVPKGDGHSTNTARVPLEAFELRSSSTPEGNRDAG